MQYGSLPAYVVDFESPTEKSSKMYASASLAISTSLLSIEVGECNQSSDAVHMIVSRTYHIEWYTFGVYRVGGNSTLYRRV